MNDADVRPTEAESQQVDDDGITRFHEHLTPIPNAKDMREALAQAIHVASDVRVILLGYNHNDDALDYLSSYPVITPSPLIYISLFNPPAEASVIPTLKRGEHQLISLKDAENRLKSLAKVVNYADQALLMPLMHDESMIGMVVTYEASDVPLDNAQITLMKRICPAVTSYFQLIEQQLVLQKRKDEIERQAEIFSQIDADLSDVTDLNYIFSMLQDWALRFTNADAAALSLYDSEANTLRVMSQYGFRPDGFVAGEELQSEQGGLTLRVANNGHAEIVPDVLVDSDYYEMVEGTRTQMSVPIKREEVVIGVLALYSRKVNGFTDEHLAFVKKLAARAGVAVDNGRLFTETRREREKLSYILRHIAEIVIVIGLDGRIVLINDSARLAFRLADEQDYTGRSFIDVIYHSDLTSIYHQAVETAEAISKEINLNNNRTYHTIVEQHPGIGHIIVMQDITHFKETDRLKTELVATVSHDLKQPLSVMRGYLDLLQMVNVFDERSQGYIGNLNYAFRTMRQLIDDLLDIARIEAGVKLDMEPVSLTDIFEQVKHNTVSPAEQKSITLTFAIPDDLPTVEGDPARLEQVFNNLVGNAVKYTQMNGYVKVYTEIKQNMLRIFVEDNGMGIGAEDQAQIFERFYRVRRPETDKIEGTGLGLAIVKSLVEAHNGQIDLKSVLGEGSTFRVTLPVG